MTMRTAVLGMAAAVALSACGRDRAGGPPRLDVAATLSGADTGYARAEGPRPFSFPADHGPHPRYRTEWWYFTGNLATQDGRRFGFELTFFRSALAASPPGRASDWAARDAWMAHFAVTDVARGSFVAHERMARGADGLAGATLEPLRVWVEDWSVAAASDPAPDLPTTSGTPLLRLRAAQGDVAVDLLLGSRKPPALQGERGMSRKGPEPGNASYYYSLTRMPVRGTVRTGDGSFAVSGDAWMDREWGTSALSAGDIGWDWFALQLDDGAELMLYRLRRRDGGASPYSAGSWIAPDGSLTPLAADDVGLRVTDHWRSPSTGVLYPSAWTLDVPSRRLRLRIRPVLRDQELDLSYRYWEGAVDVTGERSGAPVAGRGYVELTGYGQAR